MATIDLGKIKLVWRGTYAGGTAYTVDDVVQHTDGGITSSFICTTNSTGNAPSTGGSVHGSWAYLAKGAAGSVLTTQGDILYRDGSGDQRLAKGTAGQVLKINSGATAPEWAAASGGAKKLLNTTTVSSDVSAINFDNSLITSTYQVYEIIIEFLQTDASSGNEIRMKYSNDNGSSFESGLDEMLTRDRNSDVSGDAFRETATNQSSHQISSGLQTSSEGFMSGIIKIFQPMTSSLDTLIRVDCQNSVPAHANNVRVVHGAVQCNSASAINYVRIECDSGNISAAKVKLFGVN